MKVVRDQGESQFSGGKPIRMPRGGTVSSLGVSSGSELKHGRCLWSLLLHRQEHNGSAHWCGCLGGWGCVCVVVRGGGSRYLGCVSGGVATVISLGIRSSLGFRFRIRFRVGIRCRTPDRCPGC